MHILPNRVLMDAATSKCYIEDAGQNADKTAGRALVKAPGTRELSGLPSHEAAV
jgi:hypothetical protein